REVCSLVFFLCWFGISVGRLRPWMNVHGALHVSDDAIEVWSERWRGFGVLPLPAHARQSGNQQSWRTCSQKFASLFRSLAPFAPGRSLTAAPVGVLAGGVCRAGSQ